MTMPRAGAMAPTPAVVVWLSICCLLVFSTVVLGAAVRLTGSGLSMVDWRPLAGVIPPLDGAAWRHAFEQYRQFPEFKLVNPDMTLAGFKFIFWMEYAHRLLGRVIGAVFLLPFVFFLAAGTVRGAVCARLWALFAVGGVQGLLGWYMVQSGLVDDPRVSHYRLALHFMLAVAIYAYLLRVVAGIARPPPGPERSARITGTGAVAVALILVTMLSGALVAGTRAGYAYNTWPTMDGLWIPGQLLAMRPWWLNFTENIVAVQFVHRWLAAGAGVAAAVFAWRLIRARAANCWGFCILALVGVQIALGIATLLLRVPVVLGVAHQAGAMLLLSAAVIALAGHLPPLTAVGPAAGRAAEAGGSTR